MIEKKVVVKNLEVNYKLFGEGKPFLILHGWGSSSDKWQRVGELLGGNDLTAIIPDLPGFGKSQEPSYAWSLDDYVDFLDEFSKKVSELNKDFYLLGHSFGGALAAKFSIKYNQKVRKLFLVSAACIRKVTLKKKILSGLSELFKFLSILPFYNEAKRAFYRFVVGGEDYLNVEKTMKETFVKVVSEDLSNHLSFVKIPTVIIWGNKDKITPLAQAKIINSKIHNSKLIIEDAKHAMHIEKPELLSQNLLSNI